MEGLSARYLIPDGAVIESAELYLYSYQNNVSNAIVNVHRINASWSEDSVTWGNFNGAYDPIPFSSTNVNATGWQSFDIKPYIMDLQNGVYTENFGILLDLENPSGAVRYFSRESSDPTLRPYIKVTYSINGNLIVDNPELPTADAYIWQLSPDWNTGNSYTLYTGYISSSEKHALVKFDIPYINIECSECKGGVTDLTLQYEGLDSSEIKVFKGKGDKPKDIYFQTDVEPGEAFSFSGSGKDSKLGKEIKITVNGILNTKIHTSCSKPIGPGLVSGDLLVIKGVSKDGGALCPVNQGGDIGSLCEDGKPRSLIMEYTAVDNSSNTQDPGKTSVTNFYPLQSSVFIRVTDKSKPEDSKAKIWFEGVVDINGDNTFSVDAANLGENRLKSNTYIHIYDHEGRLLQSIQFHTSCSQPLNVGDKFGSVIIIDFTLEL